MHICFGSPSFSFIARDVEFYAFTSFLEIEISCLFVFNLLCCLLISISIVNAHLLKLHCDACVWVRKFFILIKWLEQDFQLLMIVFCV